MHTLNETKDDMIHEIAEAITALKGLEDIYKEALIESLNHADELTLKLLVYGVDFETIVIRPNRKSSEAWETEFDSKVVIGMKNFGYDENSVLNFVFTFFHELGHVVESTFGDMTQTDIGNIFQSKLERETKTLVEEYDLKHSREKIYEHSTKNPIIGDLISGVYKNKIKTASHHSTAYWNNHKNSVALEAFAHFFSATFLPFLIDSLERRYSESYRLFKFMLNKMEPKGR